MESLGERATEIELQVIELASTLTEFEIKTITPSDIVKAHNILTQFIMQIMLVNDKLIRLKEDAETDSILLDLSSKWGVPFDEVCQRLQSFLIQTGLKQEDDDEVQALLDG